MSQATDTGFEHDICPAGGGAGAPSLCKGGKHCGCRHKCHWSLAGSSCMPSQKAIACSQPECNNGFHPLCANQLYSDGQGPAMCWECASKPDAANKDKLKVVFSPEQPPDTAGMCMRISYTILPILLMRSHSFIHSFQVYIHDQSKSSHTSL